MWLSKSLSWPQGPVQWLCYLRSVQTGFEGQKHVSSQAVTQSSLPVAVPASIVFPPPGASEENGLPHTSTRTQLPQSMKIMHEIMYKLEVLYVLCVLLMGRQRNQVGPSPTSQNRRSHLRATTVSVAPLGMGLIFVLSVLRIRKLVSFQSPEPFPP